MTHQSLTYAEENLGVHKVYAEAEAARAELDEVVTALDKAHDAKRNLEEIIADRDADLLIEERGKHASMSATALDQHMRQVRRKDHALINLRTKQNEVLGEISGLGYDAEMLRWRLKVAVARMEELGGYFKYLAAVKISTQAERTRNQENA